MRAHALAAQIIATTTITDTDMISFLRKLFGCKQPPQVSSGNPTAKSRGNKSAPKGSPESSGASSAKTATTVDSRPLWNEERAKKFVESRWEHHGHDRDVCVQFGEYLEIFRAMSSQNEIAVHQLPASIRADKPKGGYDLIASIDYAMGQGIQRNGIQVTHRENTVEILTGVKFLIYKIGPDAFLCEWKG